MELTQHTNNLNRPNLLFSLFGLFLCSHNKINTNSINAIRCDGIPFEVTRTPYNAETRKALAEYNEMKAHPEKYKRYPHFSELLKDIEDEA